MPPANFMEPGLEQTPEEIGNLLAAQKARDAALARLQPAPESFQPYTEEPLAAEEQPPAAETDKNEELSSVETPSTEAQPPDMAAALASDMAQKRLAARKIAAARSAIDAQLAALEKDLENIRRPKGGFTSFLKLNPLDVLDITMPSLNSKINNAYNSVKNARGAAKVRAIESAVAALKILKTALIVARIVASAIDAIFKWFGLALKTRYFGPFFFVPLIILIVLLPLLVLMLAIMYGLFENGSLTSEIKALRKKINDTLSKLEKELDNEKKKISLREQRHKLEAQEQALQQSTQISAAPPPGPPPAPAAPKTPPLPPQRPAPTA